MALQPRANHAAVGRRSTLACALFPLLVAAQSAQGGPLSDFTQKEFATLPRLCHAQRFINQELEKPIVPEEQREELNEKLGHSFIHYHHYCWALMELDRADADPTDRQFRLTRAIDDLEYVIRNSDPSFSLMPGVYLKYGEVLELKQRDTDATGAYRNAIKADPTFEPAYKALIAQQLDSGDQTAATATVEEARAAGLPTEAIGRLEANIEH